MAADENLTLSEHAASNRAMWNADAPGWVDHGRRHWAAPAPLWGMFDVPEDELHILPDVRGLDVVDLGCGTGYWCAWFVRMGADPVGLDVSEGQLATARELQREHGVEFPLVHASAESAPLQDGSFDLVFSEYGAAIWCDPYAWIPEAHRLLRPGGRLIFLCNSVLATLCAPASDEPAGETLLRPQFGLHRLQWPDDDGIDFHLPHGEMLRLLRATGFEVEALHELRAPAGPDDEVRFFIRRGWARRWPCEEVWVARRTAGTAGAR
ncbi:MAG TPA: class I SAM-dependent methyltransferase [Solirubrobacteraceae bacterium]|nr:class I SAM-dependent methyltransferase [Solirubrobacteraceae bacterium]